MKQKSKDNPVIEHLKLLKKHGKLDEKEMLSAIDVLSESGNPELLREYFDEQAFTIADMALNKRLFEIPDENVDGLLRFAVTDNGKHVGINPDECHFLIAGQTGTGKSTLLKIIFSQALLLNQRQGGSNGKNNYLAICQSPRHAGSS